MAEHLSVSEIDKEAKRLKRNLEGLRVLILRLNSLLLWEKNSYISVIFGTSSVFFFLLWQLNPSFLTMISLFGIVVTVLDYLSPTLAHHFANPDNWTSFEERKLESICQSLAVNKLFLTHSIESFCQMRKDRPKRYYSIVIVSLLILSWIGSTVNNLFLTYLIVTSIIMLPGIKERQLIDKYTAYVHKLIRDKMGYGENLKFE